MAAAGVLSHPSRDHFQHAHAMYSSRPQLPSFESSRSREAPRQNDDFRPKLPSISNLLNLADGDKKSQQQILTRPRLPSPTQLVNDTRPTSHPLQISPQFAPLERPRYASQEADSRPWSSVLPPPSHLRSDSVMSAASRSPTSPSIGSPYGHGSPLLSRESSDGSYFKRQCMTSNPAASPYSGSQYGSPASYTSSPEMSSARSLHHPDSAIPPPPPSIGGGGLYNQRPLPSPFPPAAAAPPSTTTSARSTPMSPTENPYQHHHYLGTSAQSAFPQPQDRYLCPTCNKAFSRPSSLKIHMHSHTGEKPFRCPHRGCGKSFSVRSNMKRHERGCHSEIGSVSSV